MSFGIPEVDALIPGFQTGDFAALYGSPDCLWLSLLLCVRCQLPWRREPQGYSALFIDGGNSFDLYEVSRMAKSNGIPPRQALNNIYVSRAFTAYQLTSLVFEKLKLAVQKFKTKLVVIANVPWLYLDRDMPKTESKDIFNKLTLFLSDFAAENQLVIAATYALGRPWARTLFYEAALTGRANVVVRTAKSKTGLRLFLEKHPSYSLGSVEVQPRGTILTDFLEG